MGIDVEIKWGEQIADVWACLTSGCVRYEERGEGCTNCLRNT